MKRLLHFLIPTALLLSLLAGCAKENTPLALGTYTYQGSAPFAQSSVRLEEDQTFTFIFSLTSSYFCVGGYEIDGDRLLLKTQDGAYAYAFDIVGETLVFDAEHSSENTWYSEISDGAVFQLENTEEASMGADW